MTDAIVIIVVGFVFIIASNRHKPLLSGDESVRSFIRAEWAWLTLWLAIALLAGATSGPDLQDKGFGN